jgi:hypothetical protein
MAGRPRKPTLVKALEGDTRKYGANKHAESISRAHITRRGTPPDPPPFKFPSYPRGEDAGARYQDMLRKWRKKVCAHHREYLAGELTREGLLSTVDEGVLTQAAQIYTLATEAFITGDHRAHPAHTQRYMQIADRMGLNEAARVKFPKGEPEMDDLEAALCG